MKSLITIRCTDFVISERIYSLEFIFHLLEENQKIEFVEFLGSMMFFFSGSLEEKVFEICRLALDLTKEDLVQFISGSLKIFIDVDNDYQLYYKIVAEHIVELYRTKNSSPYHIRLEDLLNWLLKYVSIADLKDIDNSRIINDEENLNNSQYIKNQEELIISTVNEIDQNNTRIQEKLSIFKSINFIEAIEIVKSNSTLGQMNQYQFYQSIEQIILNASEKSNIKISPKKVINIKI